MYLLLLIVPFFVTVESLHHGVCLGQICGAHGKCHSGPVKNGSSTYWCRCDDGFGGDFCERQCNLKCRDYEKCSFDDSGKPYCQCQDCDTFGTRLPANVDCPPGYGGDKCTTRGWCHPNYCQNGGQCVGEGYRARCVCPAGFHGKTCQLDVDECKMDADACGPRSTCMNTHGTYLCVCPQGFLPPDCLTPGNLSTVEFKPAVCFLEVSPEHPNGRSRYCQNGGVCDTKYKTARCACPPGYRGPTCEVEPSAVNRCADGPCQHGTCFSFAFGFQCVCDDGYGGSFCERGQDNCVGHRCSAGATCINGVDTYHCECPIGRTGQYCEKVDCAAIPGICNHGSCIHSPMSDKAFECECEPGYEGELCDVDKNECLADSICVNNGTCVNLPGSFRCDCPRGFGGKWCDELIDLCQEVRCENEAVCIHTTDRQPVCQCKNGFIGKRCETRCPDGFGGVRCDLKLDEVVCSRNGGKCFNGGKCLGGFCTCPPDFTGNQCELARSVLSSDNTCRSEPCMNNATCIDVDAHIGYACICRAGFEGDICERPRDQCAENPCANGGTCRRIKDAFSCNCPAGFRGERCEIEISVGCLKTSCQNDGICQPDGKCECSYGFTGLRCEEKINLGVFYDKETLLRSVCEKRKCSERANDGNCDADCNYAACKFDGGDCSGKREPFSRCNYGNMCADLFSNGVCDQACNNEDCLYDGMDCMSAVARCPVKVREYCAARFANGVCDVECNTDGCGFDGGDCSNRTEAKIITDIRIKVQMAPQEFQLNGGQTLMEISSNLRAAVRIQRDQEGPLVFEWDGEHETQRVKMDVKKLVEQQVLSTSLARRVRRRAAETVVYLEVQEDCLPGKCLYTDAQSIVDIISARLAKKGTDSFGAPISEAIVATPRRSASGDSDVTLNNTFLILGVGCMMIVVMAGALTLRDNRNRKRKMINAPVWIPPMESEEKVRRHQSINSSQHSLLDTANNYYNPKRHCGEFDVDQFSQFYPQPYAYGEVQQQMSNEAAGQDDFVLHLQASGRDPITEPLTSESVNIEDVKYNRRVLHWLAANTVGKSEELIAKEAERCISAGADVNAMDCDENTALMLAVRARRVRLAIVLMRAGADPTIYNRSERSALHEAAVNRDLLMMRRLLTDQRLIRDIDELDRNGLTVLMEVARSDGDYQVEMAQLLISKGAKIDADGASRKDSEIYKGRTALHYAALVDNIPMVEFLVSRNANKDKQDEAGKTPVMLAAKEGHERTVKLLVMSGASLTTVDAMDKTAAQLAQANCHHEIAEYLRQLSRENRPVMGSNVHTAAASKMPRQTFKAVKKAGTKKASRDPSHLTPPPSDGSFSSPSPHYFPTTSPSALELTPTALESSPEYHSEMTTNGMWYSSTSPYQDYHHNPMPPNHNSFYC